jgi:hypothetical protein
LTFAVPATAQSWTEGPQTVSYPGGGNVSYPGLIGDGTTSQGGTPPAEASEVADIASEFTTSSWIVSDTSYTSSTGAENKFRFTCNFSGTGRFDPILAKGNPSFGHDHTFVGVVNFSENSDYTNLRTNGGNSHCSGGPLNRSLYWEPSMQKALPSGAVGTLKPDWVTFYYVVGNDEGTTFYRLLNGIQFIGGKWPSDLNDNARKAEIPAGFSWVTDGFSGNGMGWYCENATGNPKPYLKTAAGADPWGGTCTAGNRIYAQITAPECWDGHNLTSPTGRDHLRYFIRHNNSGKLVCPDGWWRIPAIEAKVFFSHTGPSDYMEWYASSDRMDANPANWALNGQSFHFDYIQAWDPTVLDTFQINCIGIKIGATNGDPHQCDTGTISTTQRLKGGAVGEASPDGSQPSPIVDFGHNYASNTNDVRFAPLSTGTTGTFVIDHDHN